MNRAVGKGEGTCNLGDGGDSIIGWGGREEGVRNERGHSSVIGVIKI